MLGQCEGMDIVDCDVINIMIFYSYWVFFGKKVNFDVMVVVFVGFE